MENNQTFAFLAEKFGIKGEVIGFEVVRHGHINGTYDVAVNQDGEEKHFFFQRVNTFVFKAPEQIMSNIAHVTGHISKKLADAGESQDGVMHFLSCADGNNYYIDGENFWRVSVAVPNALTINVCTDPASFRHSGEGFGRFQTLLADFDASKLYETIPNFHNTKKRLETFWASVESDPCNRAGALADDIERIRALAPLACRLGEMLDAGELPLRVTHNDTKINNIIFDKDTLEAKTVIDLDTVMPGLVAHDFGDAIRFTGNAAKEDEADLSLVRLDMNMFRAFTEGFIGEVKNALTPAEINTLALGAFTMTLELVVRFLGDYLDGDKYFKIAYPEHNLVRARCQLRLAEDMFAKLDEMNAVVAQVAGA